MAIPPKYVTSAIRSKAKSTGPDGLKVIRVSHPFFCPKTIGHKEVLSFRNGGAGSAYHLQSERNFLEADLIQFTLTPAATTFPTSWPNCTTRPVNRLRTASRNVVSHSVVRLSWQQSATPTLIRWQPTASLTARPATVVRLPSFARREQRDADSTGDHLRPARNTIDESVV